MKALAAEVTQKFSEKLACCGVVVKELTGDMQLTQRELQATQVIVTTPEKWDVITRKSTDSAFSLLVRLLVLDEVRHVTRDTCCKHHMLQTSHVTNITSPLTPPIPLFTPPPPSPSRSTSCQTREVQLLKQSSHAH